MKTETLELSALSGRWALEVRRALYAEESETAACPNVCCCIRVAVNLVYRACARACLVVFTTKHTRAVAAFQHGPVTLAALGGAILIDEDDRAKQRQRPDELLARAQPARPTPKLRVSEEHDPLLLEQFLLQPPLRFPPQGGLALFFLLSAVRHSLGHSINGPRLVPEPWKPLALPCPSKEIVLHVL